MHTNRLIHEKSPYLLQHAHNPVDWYPWGEEAFGKAKQEQKPIFLSIGYSTCHWCHVMERESFENEEIAALLNKYFVCIKIDREERPDIDRVYMTFVQALTGSGGWPSSVWLTPDLKPFFGGTYFPPDSRYGRPGFGELLQRIAKVWQEERENMIASSKKWAQGLQEYAQQKIDREAKLTREVFDLGFHQFANNYDEKFAGFGSAPKFPRPTAFNFLLRYYQLTKEEKAKHMSFATLRAMAQGGMYDQIGGGFHRYSTDERWHVPHFEKMLYDQAQLVIAYAEAYQISKEPVFAATIRDVLNYIARDMTSKDGAFFSAEDADSAKDQSKPNEKSEGAFYIWSQQEIDAILGGQAALFCYRFAVRENGNALADPHGEFTGQNILYQEHSLAEAGEIFSLSIEQATARLEETKQKLFLARKQRPRPHLDDKILTAWNGLMISAFAKTAQALNEKTYAIQGEKAADFILKIMQDKEGNLRRRYRDGEAAIPAFSDDYAFLIQGLLDLYEASLDAKWFTHALRLAKQHKQFMWDAQDGAFFETSGKDAYVLFRNKEGYDGAEPAANSVAALNCLRLAQYTNDAEWAQMAEQIFQYFATTLQTSPQAMPCMLAALDYQLAKPKQIIIAGAPQSSDTQAMLKLVQQEFIPNKIIILADNAITQKTFQSFLPFLDTLKPIASQATAFVCENYTCQLPTNDLQKFAELLRHE